MHVRVGQHDHATTTNLLGELIIINVRQRQRDSGIICGECLNFVPKFRSRRFPHDDQAQVRAVAGTKRTH